MRFMESTEDKVWWATHREICAICFVDNVHAFARRAEKARAIDGEGFFWLKWHLTRLKPADGWRMMEKLAALEDEEFRELVGDMEAARADYVWAQ